MGAIHLDNVFWAWATMVVLVCAIVTMLVLRRRIARGKRIRWLVRAVVIVLILLALAGPSWVGSSAPPQLNVLVDRSASMPPGWASDMLTRLSARLDGITINAFAFARQSEPISPGQPIAPADAADGSDPGPAIQSAIAARIDRDPFFLLLSDGDWTHRPSWPSKARIWSLCPAKGRANVGLADLIASPIPATQPDDPPAVAVRAVLASTRDGFATVRLRQAADQRVAVSAGQLRSVDWVVPSRALAFSQGRQSGFLLHAEVLADFDEIAADNRLAALVPPAEGRRTAVLVGVDHTRPSPLAKALGAVAGWQALTSDPGPLTTSGLLDSPRPPDAVVLDDLPVFAAGADFFAAVGRYVRAGGALLVVGGPNSLGAGGYYTTSLEPLLATKSRPTNRPPAAIVLLLDRSGSMNEPPDLPGQPEAPVSKLDLLKQAVLALPDLFTTGDQLALIGFAEDAKTAYASSAGREIDWQAVRKAMLEMNAAGGTAVQPGLNAAVEWLARQDLSRKHLLLLSDGKFSDLTIEQAEDKLKHAAGPRARLTVSTFAASEQAERPFLAELARRFDGAFHPPGQWGQLPERFRDDLAGATVEPILSGPFAVEAIQRTEPAAAILPPITRLLTIEARPQTDVWYSASFRSPGIPDDHAWPLVAVAPVGAGRSGVIATSFASGWSDAWSQADRAGLLGRLLADLAGDGDDPRFTLHVSPESESGLLRVELDARLPADGKPINLLDLRAELIGANGGNDRQRINVPLRQVAPGRYASAIECPDASRLLITEHPAGPDGKPRVVVRRTLAAMLPAELLHLSPQPKMLDELCRGHGGRLLSSMSDLAELRRAILESHAGSSAKPIALWPWLLIAALIGWLVDVMVTRPTGPLL